MAFKNTDTTSTSEKHARPLENILAQAVSSIASAPSTSDDELD